MAIEDHVYYLINAAAKSAAEDRKINKKYGIDHSSGSVNFTSPDFVRWLVEPRIEVRKMEQYLEELDHTTLLKLIILLNLYPDSSAENPKSYFSKDYRSAKEHFSKDSREEIIRTIVSLKGSFLFAFHRGLFYVKKNKRDIDKL